MHSRFVLFTSVSFFVTYRPFSIFTSLPRKFSIFSNNAYDLSQAPTFTIAANAGFDGSLIYSKLLEQDNLNLGFDAAKG